MKPDTNHVYCTFYDAPEHLFPGHPESPRRLQSLQPWLQNPPYPEMVWLNFLPALAGDVLNVHCDQMLQNLQSSCRMGTHEIDPAPTYVTDASYHSAMMAAGATLAVSRRIISEERGRGFAIVRPPGHHAESDRSMGFCLINNVAIAAADAIARGLSKVAIVDFDAHHGNGTESIFLHTEQVGFLSLHEEYHYPGSGHMNSAPHARGRIINIPMPSYANSEAYLSIFQNIVTPWLRQFGAEMLLVSAGFDTHFSDPLTTATLDTHGFHEMTRILVDLAETFCHGRILFVLEGGYEPQALKDNIQACLAAMCARPTFPDNFGPSDGRQQNLSELIKKIRDLHQITED
jgi:acetoin utilization deacetylase AcuC-like enzyme